MKINDSSSPIITILQHYFADYPDVFNDQGLKTAINNLSTAYSQFAHFLVNFANAFSRNRYILDVPFSIHYTVYYIILNNKISVMIRQKAKPVFFPLSSIHCLEGVLLWCLSQFMTRLCLNASNTLRTMQTVTDQKCKIVMCR